MMETTNDTIPLSCRYEVLPGANVLERLENAAELGFDAVSLPGRYLNEYIAELRGCLDASPVPLASMSLGFTGSLVSPDMASRRKCRESLHRLFNTCADLGIKSVNVPPALIQDNAVRFEDPGHRDTVEEAQDDLLLDALPDLGDLAAECGLMFLLEPVNKYESEYLNCVPHAARLCRTLNHPSIGMTCDFFHMQMEELITPKSLEEAGEWIKHVHVAENTRVEPGPGSMDFLPGFTALKKIGYAGMIEIECRGLSGAGAEVLPRSVKFLRELWAKA